MRLVRATLAVAILLFAHVSSVQAQAKPAVPPADDIEAAKAHYAAGSAYYDQANYADAVKEFNEAYRLSKRIDLLYNIAVCYERLNQYDNAIATLREYLTEKPNAPDRVTIQTRIDNLSKRRDEAKAPPPPPANPPSTPPPATPAVTAPPSENPAPRSKMAWYLPGVIVGAAGVLVLGGSLGTGLAADSIHKSLGVKCLGNVCPESERNNVNTGQALAITSDVLLAVGAAATAAGVILLIVQSRHRAPSSHAARLVPTLSGLQVRF